MRNRAAPVLALVGLIAALSFAALAHGEGVPRWTSEGQMLAGALPVKTRGTLTFLPLNVPVTCRVKDAETIANPPSMGEAGTNEITAFAPSGCMSRGSPQQYCPKNKWEIVAANLPWHSHLALEPSLPGVRDVIEGAELEARCPGGRFLARLHGKLNPKVGTSVLEFEPAKSATFSLEATAGNDGLKAKGPNHHLSAVSF
ncbi:MAG TPA: hypothetical protein VNZ05_07935 [Solirubrobacteraceae bacterium]|jgi:hypothetical protein|nr:hypothetical protein [Solirubrobacteraceae bacterium]